jgi:hypothetical protein
MAFRGVEDAADVVGKGIERDYTISDGSGPDQLPSGTSRILAIMIR